MVNEDELRKRLRARISEIALRHGRQSTPEMRAEVYAVCMGILEKYGVEDEVEISLDPVQDIEGGSVKVWIGGLPGLQVVPDAEGD